MGKIMSKGHCLQHETSLFQACEAWKKEAEESIRKAKSAEEEKATISKQKDEVKPILPVHYNFRPTVWYTSVKCHYKALIFPPPFPCSRLATNEV
jgi:hypothetical protein